MRRLLKACFAACLLCAAVLSAEKALALDFSEFSFKGFEGRGPLEFNSPEDIVLTKDNKVITADFRNNRVQILDCEGNFIGMIPDSKAPSTEAKLAPEIIQAKKQNLAKMSKIFKRPTGLALDNDGRLYISMMEADTIAVVDIESKTLIGTICSSGKQQGALWAPMDIDISADGKIAVAEWQNRRVQVLNMKGDCIKELIYNEETKKGNYSAVRPRGVHWLPNGNLVVAYPTYNQVVCWNINSGGIVFRYGAQKGSDEGLLNNPSFITDAPNENLLISDSLNNRIVEITKDGKFFEHHTKKSAGTGALKCPRGLALTKDESLIIADQGNNRLCWLQPGQTTLLLREVKKLGLKDDWGKAMPKIEHILNMQPNNKEAHELMVNALYYFGDDAFNKKKYAEAEDCYRRILRYHPSDPNISKKLDSIFWAKNQGLIANAVFGIIATIVGLILIWVLKLLFSRFFKAK